MEYSSRNLARSSPVSPSRSASAYAVGSHADLHRQRVFAQIFGLCPFAKQLPSLLAAEDFAVIFSQCHVVHFTCCNVWFAFFRVSSGLLGLSSVCA